MNRRAFLWMPLIGLVGSAFAEAQERGKVYRLGVLGQGVTPPPEEHSRSTFRRALRELGWIVGENVIVVDTRAEGIPARTNALAVDLVSKSVDVILVLDAPSAWAAKRATNTIPLVMLGVTDPLELGLIASLRRPEANVTGLSPVSLTMVSKNLQLLREFVPSVARLGVVWIPANPASAASLKAAQQICAEQGIAVVAVPFERDDDLRPALAALVRGRVDALNPHAGTPVRQYWPQLIEFANKRRIPTFSSSPDLPGLGGLMSHGPDWDEAIRRSAQYIDRLFRGAKPADLPVEQPTKYELIINAKTARILGLTIPPALLLRADRVID